MAKHRFIRDEFDLSGDKLKINDRRLVHQISDVLRMDAGDTIGLCDGKYNEAEGVIRGIDKDEIIVELTNKFENNNEPELDVALFCSIVKNKNFDWIVEKATEVGISEIVPIVSKRTVKTGLKPDRLNKKIREAAELSGRGSVPKLREKMELKQAFEIVPEGETGIFFDHSGQKIDSKESYESSVSIFIGPEGGWSDAELKRAKDRDFKIRKLGQLNLRTETAAVVGSYEVLN
ncbi:MAG: 16S rRNA (uracil(1498)-N(3))-methyltransferase [Candidatus Paceibacteria bacterium]